MIINGDFKQGNKFFTSDYIFISGAYLNEGYYTIYSNTKSRFEFAQDSCTGHGTGKDSMMIVNGEKIVVKLLWKQTVQNLIPFRDYQFSFWHQNAYKSQPPIFTTKFNGIQISPPALASAKTCSWEEYSQVWTNGAGTSVTIEITDINVDSIGNDFAIDDISLKQVCDLSLPKLNNVRICNGDKISFGAMPAKGFPPYTYDWAPKQFLDSYNIASPEFSGNKDMTYYLTITDSMGCKVNDSVKVIVDPLPVPIISALNGVKLCPCDSLELKGSPDGGIYSWSKFNTSTNNWDFISNSQKIKIGKSGRYSLILNQQNCTNSTEITITDNPIDIAVSLTDTMRGKPGDIIRLPLKISSQSDLSTCVYTTFHTKLKYNKSLLVPRNYKGSRSDSSGFEIIDTTLYINSPDVWLEFMAVLGDSFCTDIIAYNPDSFCPGVKVSIGNGRFCLDSNSVCMNPNPRFINTEKILYLKQSSPNPVTDNFEIDFGTIENGLISLTIFNSYGEPVSRYSTVIKDAGSFTFKYNSEKLTSGVYFYTLSTATQSLTKKLIVAH
ncbi:MAG: T9SS type A sorting domain-containing protein [Candidatus Kapabacteria bacterium]|nr:T9SS type A sorting domain-containing protein [Candidatus Kapabacteria bacterium]